MSRAARQPAARFVATAGLVGVIALLASACAAGGSAMTLREHSAVLGTAGDVGSLHIRDLLVLPPSGNSYPRGSNPVLRGYIANTGSTAATVTAVTSPQAAGATLLAASGLTGPGATPNPVAVPTATTPAGGPVTVPANGLVAVFAQLQSLRQSLFTGQYLRVGLQFGNGTSTTMEVPIAAAPVAPNVPPFGTASASPGTLPSP